MTSLTEGQIIIENVALKEKLEALGYEVHIIIQNYAAGMYSHTGEAIPYKTSPTDPKEVYIIQGTKDESWDKEHQGHKKTIVRYINKNTKESNGGFVIRDQPNKLDIFMESIAKYGISAK